MKALTPLIKACVGLTLVASLSFGSEKTREPTPKKSPQNCAILTRFEGDVQILNASREDFVQTTLKSFVPCGGWITVRSGWAVLHHKNGFDLRMGPETFMEIHDTPEQAVLYRGRLWIESPGGTPQFKVLTANAAAEFKRGVALLTYSPGDEETQLVVLEHEATLGNRFVANRKLRVRAGENSSLNLKLLRVVPTSPSATTTASLKEILEGLPLSAQERSHAVLVVQKRQDRKFASQLEGTGKKSAEMLNEKSGRSLASSDGRSKASEAAKEEWASHLIGGDPAGEDILYPKRWKGKARRGGVQVIDPALEMDRKKFREEESEKKKLIDELSQIQVD